MGVSLTPDTVAAIEALFETHRRLNRAPRLAWGVVSDGSLIASGGHDANAQTVFRIASMTKSFTAAAVLALRDEGAFALDDPIVEHAPELSSLVAPTSDAPAITIRHLLTMNSGLATDDPWADRHLDFSDAQLDAWLVHGARFAVDPGTAMQYSNLGYGLLGRVVLRVTGQPVQRLVTERFIDPLAMRSTVWSVDALGAGADVAVGTELFDAQTREVAMLGDGTIAPMGGLFTTVEDLARWVGWLSAAFPARDEPDAGPLRRSSRREMQQAATMFAPDVRVSLDGHRRSMQGGYGMGLMRLHHDDLGAVVTHSGGLPGYGSNMRWVIGSVGGLGVVALANVTYARMADATAAALELVHARGAVSLSTVPIPSDARDACGRLVELCNDWNDAAADAIFSDNVAMDQSYERRATSARNLVERHGALRIVDVEALSAAECDIVARGALSDATVRIEVQFSCQVPARIQWYEFVGD